MIRHVLFGSCLALTVLALSGCTPQTPEPNKQQADGSKYLLAAEPAGAKGVIETRKDAKDKQEVVVVGRIGGGKDPWVNGQAAFDIVDVSLKACSEIDGDTCPTPWDYCCEPDLSKKKILVKVVDEQGKLVRHDAKTLLRVKELQTVIVQGTVTRDNDGNVTVLAKAVFVKQ